MYFEVTFINKDNKNVISIDQKYVGLSHLDKVRVFIGDSSIQKEEVNSNVSCMYERYVRIDVSEGVARESGHFNNTAHVDVSVVGNLNKFVHECIREMNSGRSYGFRYDLDKEDVITAWKQAGYPLEWDLS